MSASPFRLPSASGTANGASLWPGAMPVTSVRWTNSELTKIATSSTTPSTPA
jgi:hypothetical protein